MTTELITVEVHCRRFGYGQAHYQGFASAYELVTRSCSGLLEASPADEAAGEGDEGVVEFGA
ncbi:hypothetical protein ABZ557_26815, partial [Streptomyces sp. NPDC019645]